MNVKIIEKKGIYRNNNLTIILRQLSLKEAKSTENGDLKHVSQFQLLAWKWSYELKPTNQLISGQAFTPLFKFWFLPYSVFPHKLVSQEGSPQT